MKKGKLIVIEGTDCSGKETQTKMLTERLKNEGVEVFTMSFPRYDTPTGKIIGGPLLGKEQIGASYFKDPANIQGEVASLYYAADRLYNIKEIEDNLDKGITVILDRYTISNMAHQGGKFDNSEKRKEIFSFIDELEFKLLKLPRPDNVIFLHMPYEYAKDIRKNRKEKLDKVEENEEYLKRSEKTYIELAELYHFKTINCISHNQVRTIEDINNELYELVKEIING